MKTKMKCPYRKTTTPKPEMKGYYSVKYAQDIEEFADCYEETCFFWTGEKCLKVIADMRGEEK